MTSLWRFDPLAFNKTLPHRIFSAWYGPWVKPKLRSSLHCTSTESGQNIARCIFALISWWTYTANFHKFRCLSWKSLPKTYFVPGKTTKKEKVDRHGNRFEMFQTSLWYCGRGLYLMHPRCCCFLVFFQQYLSSFTEPTEPGKMMGLRAWRSSPQGLLSVVEGGLERDVLLTSSDFDIFDFLSLDLWYSNILDNDCFNLIIWLLDSISARCASNHPIRLV